MRLFALGLLVIFSVIAVSFQPAFAKSFKGTVLQITAYSITVQNNPDDIKIFQIRAETKRPPDVAPQDVVKVHYRDDNGILIAEKIDVKLKFGQ